MNEKYIIYKKDIGLLEFEKGFRMNYFVIFVSFVVKNILLVPSSLSELRRTRCGFAAPCNLPRRA